MLASWGIFYLNVDSGEEEKLNRECHATMKALAQARVEYLHGIKDRLQVLESSMKKIESQQGEKLAQSKPEASVPSQNGRVCR